MHPACNGVVYQLSNEACRIQRKAFILINISKPTQGGSSYNDYLGVYSVADAYNIDVKMDDGLARSGQLLSYRSFRANNCLDGIDGDYNISDPQKISCMSQYLLK